MCYVNHNTRGLLTVLHSTTLAFSATLLLLLLQWMANSKLEVMLLESKDQLHTNILPRQTHKLTKLHLLTRVRSWQTLHMYITTEPHTFWPQKWWLKVRLAWDHHAWGCSGKTLWHNRYDYIPYPISSFLSVHNNINEHSVYKRYQWSQMEVLRWSN